MMRGCIALLVTVAAVAVAPSAVSAATAADLACGDIVVADVTLQADLTGCETGLVIGADNVTIDLNGHTIEGQSIVAGVGVEAVGRSGVRVVDGSIRSFALGVLLLNTTESTVAKLTVRDTGIGVSVSGTGDALSNRVVRNDVARVNQGIVFFAPSTVVAENRVAQASRVGISCRGSGRIDDNRVVRSAAGIELLFCTADVVGNEAIDNEGAGIARVRSQGLTARNRANGNGTGILSDDSHGLFSRNVTNDNLGHGLVILDQDDTHGALHTVDDHVANANGGLGITSNVLGVVVSGKVRAHANGDPRQCVNIACR
jgi:copper-binding protein NosD